MPSTIYIQTSKKKLSSKVTLKYSQHTHIANACKKLDEIRIENSPPHTSKCHWLRWLNEIKESMECSRRSGINFRCKHFIDTYSHSLFKWNLQRKEKENYNKINYLRLSSCSLLISWDKNITAVQLWGIEINPHSCHSSDTYSQYESCKEKGKTCNKLKRTCTHRPVASQMCSFVIYKTERKKNTIKNEIK